MLGLLLILTVTAVCNSQEDNFLKQSLFSAITEGCEQLYSTKGVQVGSEHYSTFLTKLQAIETQNNNVENTYTSAANCFTALSDQEMSRWLGVIPPLDNESEYDLARDSPLVGDSQEMVGAPEQYDRRDDGTTTPARSQGNCGSCWSFSAIAVLESAYLKLTGAQPSDVDFSEQQLLDCTYESYPNQDGCDGGWMVDAWWNLKSSHSSKLVSEADKPYLTKDKVCSTSGLNNAFSKVEITKVWRSDDHSGKTTPMGVRTAQDIYEVSAVAVAWRMEDAFSSYSKGVFNKPCTGSEVDHALTLVGYSTGYFIAKNSWGEDWGEKGHVRLSRDKGNLCSFLSYVMYPEVKCRFGVDNNGKCAENPKPTEAPQPEPECTKKCYRGKVCYWNNWRHETRMGCQCPTGTYGWDCQEKINCAREDRGMCVKRKLRWSADKFNYKCLKKMGLKVCPHVCGHCDE